MEFKRANDIQKKIGEIVITLSLTHINANKIVCFRSFGSQSRATARIWSLPRIWQQALNTSPHYVIEILTEKFDRLKNEDKTKVLIHELLHIPKTFSGSLRPHRTGTFRLDQRIVNNMYREYKKNKNC